VLDYHSQPTKQKQVVCQVCEDALQNERILSSLSQNGSFQKKMVMSAKKQKNMVMSAKKQKNIVMSAKKFGDVSNTNFFFFFVESEKQNSVTSVL